MPLLKIVLLTCISFFTVNVGTYGRVPITPVQADLLPFTFGNLPALPLPIWQQYAATPDTAGYAGNGSKQPEKDYIQSLLDSGLQQFNKRAFALSISNYRLALQHCNKEDARLAFQAYSGIAKCYTIQGDYEEAALHFYKAITIAENVTGPAIRQANTFTNLSVIWNLLGDRQRSLAYLERAATYAIKEKDSTALGNIINKKGNIYLYLDTNQARKLYRQALYISKACNDHSTATMATANLAYIHILNGRTAEARTLLSRFYQMFQSKDLDQFHRLSLYYTYGLYSFLLKDYAIAEKTWLQAITLAGSANAPLYTVKPLEGLSMLYAATGSYDKAYYFQQLHDSLNSRIVNEEKLKSVNALESKYRLAQKEKALALHQLKVAEQKAALVKQNILIATGIALSILLMLLYLGIRKNSRRKLVLEQKKNQVRNKQKELEHIKTIMEGEEKERRRVALELHDGIGSMLSMAKLNVSMVRDQYTGHSGNSGFNEVLQLIDQSSQAVRSTAHNLMPEILLQGGLDEGLNLYCAKLAKARQMNIDYQYYGQPVLMEVSREKMLFRILQEVMRMVIDCSGARKVLLQLNWQEDLLYVTLQTYDSHWDMDNKEEQVQEEWRLLQRKIAAADGMLYLEHISVANPAFDLEFQF